MIFENENFAALVTRAHGAELFRIELLKIYPVPVPYLIDSNV